MPAKKGGKRKLSPTLVENSPLRRIDPRVKLVMGMSASLAVMLPLERLLIFIAVFILLLAWGRVLPIAARQVWRLKWFIVLLFILDTWLEGWQFALLITIRLAMLASVFTLLVATTTPGEFNLALESLRLPYRYAFSIGLAFQSLGLLEEELQAIYEAQRSRGLLVFEGAWREKARRVGDLIALTVPAIVLTTRRAWSITEAAYARGFDAPHRRPLHKLHMAVRDWLALAATGLALSLIFI